jgi:hypothetical protein
MGEGSPRAFFDESLLGILQKDEETGIRLMGDCPLDETEERERVEDALLS